MFKEIVNTLNGKTRRHNKINVAVGTTVGVLVGAAAGLLLAPKPGYETREDIKNVAIKGYDEASEAAGKAVKFAQKEVSALKGKVKDLRTHAKHAKDIVEDAAENLAEELKTKV